MNTHCLFHQRPLICIDNCCRPFLPKVVEPLLSFRQESTANCNIYYGLSLYIQTVIEKLNLKPTLMAILETFFNKILELLPRLIKWFRIQLMELTKFTSQLSCLLWWKELSEKFMSQFLLSANTIGVITEANFKPYPLKKMGISTFEWCLNPYRSSW